MAEFIQKTDTLNEGREKINAAIQDAEDAKTIARQAENVSEQAKQIAQTAENKADNVQEQFNQVVIEGDSSVEAAQARVTADGRVFETLRDRLNYTDRQLAQNATYYLLSEMNLTDDGVENLNKIMDKLTKDNIYFVVDGIYPLASKKTHELEYDLNLISFNNGGFVFNNEDDVNMYFDTRSSVRIINVSFTNNTNQLKILFGNLSNESKPAIDEIYVNGCSFEGNIRLSYLHQIESINTVNVIHNKINNNKYSFFQIAGANINTVNIKYNEVKNWFYRCFSITEGDGKILQINVENNFVTNTDSWVFDEEALDGTYYVFALIEAYETNYRNNHVENMKSMKHIALYDCYAGGRVNNYTGNTFKNNVCFDFSRINQLMKAKSEGSIKKFNNNRFIIESEFLTKFGYDPANFKVQLYDIWGGDGITDHTKEVEYEIMNNEISVPNLKLEESRRLVKKFVFVNNNINTRLLEDNLVCTRFKNAIVKIKDNYFNVESDGGIFTLVNNQLDEENPLLLVEIHGNTFNKGFQNGSYAVGKTIDIQNNTIITDTESSSRLLNYSFYDYIIAENNTYIGEQTKELFNQVTARKQLISKNTGRIYRMDIRLDTIIHSGKDKKINITVESFEGISKYRLTVKANVVTFTDRNGNIREFSFLSDVGNGVGVQNEGDVDNTSLTFLNNNNATRVRLSIDADILPTIHATIL